MAGSDRVENEVVDDLPDSFHDVAASSTVMKPTKKKRGRPKKSVVFTEALEELSEEPTEEPEHVLSPPPAKRGRGRPPLAELTVEPDVVLTPPPPTPPPATRGRGRPAHAELSSESDVVLTPPPPTPPPAKRGRGRPRKI